MKHLFLAAIAAAAFVAGACQNTNQGAGSAESGVGGAGPAGAAQHGDESRHIDPQHWELKQNEAPAQPPAQEPAGDATRANTPHSQPDMVHD